MGKQIRYGYSRVQLRNGQVNTFGGIIYFAGDGTLQDITPLLS